RFYERKRSMKIAAAFAAVILCAAIGQAANLTQVTIPLISEGDSRGACSDPMFSNPIICRFAGWNHQKDLVVSLATSSALDFGPVDPINLWLQTTFGLATVE